MEHLARSIAHGCIAGCNAADEIITTSTVPGRHEPWHVARLSELRPSLTVKK
jgi:hypothetical protein